MTRLRAEVPIPAGEHYDGDPPVEMLPFDARARRYIASLRKAPTGERLRSPEKAVLFDIATELDPATGCAEVSYRILSRWTGITRSALMRIVRDMARKGLICRYRRFAAVDNASRANAYSILGIPHIEHDGCMEWVVEEDQE